MEKQRKNSFGSSIKLLSRRRKNWYVKKKVKKKRRTYVSVFELEAPYKSARLLQSSAKDLKKGSQMPKQSNDMRVINQTLVDYYALAKQIRLLSDMHEKGVEETLIDKFGADRDFVTSFVGKSEEFIEEELDRLSSEYYSVASRPFGP